MKKLFVLVKDCGDGSYYPCYTLNEDWIAGCVEMGDKLKYYFPSAGGDGFHYDVLMVDDNFTLGPEHSDISKHYRFGDEE